jgi:hypothetical protein
VVVVALSADSGALHVQVPASSSQLYRAEPQPNAMTNSQPPLLGDALLQA